MHHAKVVSLMRLEALDTPETLLLDKCKNLNDSDIGLSKRCWCEHIKLTDELSVTHTEPRVHPLPHSTAVCHSETMSFPQTVAGRPAAASPSDATHVTAPVGHTHVSWC